MMQPASSQPTPYDRAMMMERTILEVRRHWFGAYELDRGGAVSVMEPGGELLMFIDREGPRVEELLAAAAQRGAYVVATDYSRPLDLGARLTRSGFRMIQRHGAYVYEGPQAVPLQTQRRDWLGFLRWREALTVRVAPVSPEELPAWNEVCWWAFGPRGTLEASLLEKERAYLSMGARGTWYLACAGDRPVGTACLFQGAQAAQVLAVGTLPAYRGRGVARAVMQQVIADWEERGSGLLFLDTSPGSPAERLYLKLGFRPVYIRELYAPVSR